MMRVCATRMMALAALALMLGGCAAQDGVPRNLVKFRTTTGTPDEFAIAPTRELQVPPDGFALPSPDPDAIDRTQQDPIADALVALGGSSAALSRAGIPSGDSAVVAHASRYGSDPAIRETLLEEDRDYRGNNRPQLIPRALSGTTYFSVYARQSLDQQREIDRLRGLGVFVPSAPPKELQPQ